jgi:hypothetical protein
VVLTARVEQARDRAGRFRGPGRVRKSPEIPLLDASLPGGILPDPPLFPPRSEAPDGTHGRDRQTRFEDALKRLEGVVERLEGEILRRRRSGSSRK